MKKEEFSKLVQGLSKTKEGREMLLGLISAGQSSKIKKGYFLESVVLDLLKTRGLNVERAKNVKFTDISKHVKSSQKSYNPDLILKLDKDLYIIDCKSGGWNNNTPIFETISKYIKTKMEVSNLYKDYNVHFMLLKNSKSVEGVARLNNQSIEYGISIEHADTWLSELLGIHVNLDAITEDVLFENICEKYNELVLS